MASNFDIIGDIHGCHHTLTSLLESLGYSLLNGVYHHKSRKIIFLGDFIDRGPGQREVIDIVRPMIEQGHALSVMGNHEFNAIAYATQKQDGMYLREHSDKNRKQHQAFLDAYQDDPDVYQSAVNWFKTLPLWLDLGECRIVHACWDAVLIQKLQAHYDKKGLLTDVLLHDASNPEHWVFNAVETLLKGKEIPLKNGLHFYDTDGNPRHHIRIKWWEQTVATYKAAFMGPESARTHIPDDVIEGDHLIKYGHELPPVFLGHYWMEGQPASLASNIACLDYSVAKPGGKLVAYCWQGEQQIEAEHFIYVDRIED